MELSVPALMDRVPDDAAAYRFLEELRWGDEPVCPHCGVIGGHYFLTPKSNEGRTTRTGNVTVRRLWKCHACRKQFSVLTGTVMHGTKISVRTWVLVTFEMCASKNGVASREIERKYGLTPKSAWFMMHRIREAMKSFPRGGLVGSFVADETYLGGDPKNKHKADRKKMPRGRGTEKTAVFSLLHRETGEIHSRVINTVDGRTIRDAIKSVAEPKGSTLETDAWTGYHRVAPEFDGHGVVNHSEGEYVDKLGSTTNPVENFFSQLKRSIDGTHHRVSVEHLPRYLAEFDYRYTTRNMTDTQRVARLMGQVAGRRLTYKPLTGR
jgi:transposase-like protein